MGDQLVRPNLRSVVALLLIAYAIWPLVHRQLVERVRINPWKLAGWAMYTTAAPRGAISAVGIDEDGRPRNLRLDTTPSLTRAREDYLGSRISLGLSSDPLPMAEALASAHPQFTAWHLIVEQVGLSPRAYIEPLHRSTYSFRRGPLGLELAAADHEASNPGSAR